MSTPILIIGSAGSGKSTSIRNLDPKSTFIISVLGKDLPFRGWRSNYVPIKNWEDKEGNLYVADDWQRVIKCIQTVDESRPEITTLLIDDWQYILSHEFLKRGNEKGYDKFTDIAMHGWATMTALRSLRSDLMGIVLAHNDVDQYGFSSLKTIGKLLSEKMSLEGLFTICLHTRVKDGEYYFQTQQDHEYMARSPMDMFADILIQNDLQYVKTMVENYDKGEE